MRGEQGRVIGRGPRNGYGKRHSSTGFGFGVFEWQNAVFCFVCLVKSSFQLPFWFGFCLIRHKLSLSIGSLLHTHTPAAEPSILDRHAADMEKLSLSHCSIFHSSNYDAILQLRNLHSLHQSRFLTAQHSELFWVLGNFLFILKEISSVYTKA